METKKKIFEILVKNCRYIKVGDKWGYFFEPELLTVTEEILKALEDEKTK